MLTPLAGLEASTAVARPQHEGSHMKTRGSSVALLTLVTSVIVAVTAVAAPDRAYERIAAGMFWPGTGSALIHPFCTPCESIEYGSAGLQALASESTTMSPGDCWNHLTVT